MELNLENKNYNVLIIRKSNKNLYIRVDEDLNIKVTCPYLYTNNMIKKILNKNQSEIIKMIKNQETRNKKNVYEEECLLGNKLNIIYENVNMPIYEGNKLIIKDDKMLNNWYKKQASMLFKVYLDEAYDCFEEKIPYPKLKIRSMKTRWGVCNKKDNSVTLNLELIKKDHKYLNYVIVHELSHFVHFNHSKEFWKTVEKYCPLYKNVRKELRK